MEIQMYSELAAYIVVGFRSPVPNHMTLGDSCSYTRALVYLAISSTTFEHYPLRVVRVRQVFTGYFYSLFYGFTDADQFYGF